MIRLIVFLSILTVGCTTRINQNAGGDALVTISTHTAVQPSTAVGSNPVASIDVSGSTTKGQ